MTRLEQGQDEEAGTQAPRRWARLRGGRRRRQRRRPDRYLCRQRHEPELPVPQPGRRDLRRRLRPLGAAYDVNGQAQSGMGVDAEDVDGDGLPELFVTNFANEYNTLYQNFGKGVFFDSTAFFGLASDTMPWVGWGCAWPTSTTTAGPTASSANGHVDNNRQELDQPVDYEEIPLSFRNTDRGEAVPAGDPRRGTLLRHQARGPGRDVRRPRQRRRHRHRHQPQGRRRRPCSATTPSRPTTGSGSSSREPGATATPSARSFSSPRERMNPPRADDPPPRKGGYSLQATNDPACWWASARRRVKKVEIQWPSGIVAAWRTSRSTSEYKVVEPKDGKPEPVKKPAETRRRSDAYLPRTAREGVRPSLGGV